MRRGLNGFRSLRWAAAALAFGAMMLVATAAAAQEGRARRGPRRPTRPTLQPGVEAPDFELPRLTFEKDEKGKTVGKLSEEKVRLSSFRGKRPVCIFSSSYT